MDKTMFQVSGKSDTGEIKARLLGKSDDAEGLSIDLVLDTPVELTLKGDYELILDVDTYPSISQTLTVEPNTSPPVIAPGKDGLIMATTLTRQCFKDVLSAEESDSLFLLNAAFGHPREILLVSGTTGDEDATSYDSLAETYGKKRHARTQAESRNRRQHMAALLTHFSFESGLRTTSMLAGRGAWVVVDGEDLGRAGQSANGAPGGMSITDAYDWILDAGDAAPGRVIELSLLGRGDMTGPILADTLDRSLDTNRDPQDSNPRIKDFDGENIDMSRFAAAFSDTAQNFIFTNGEPGTGAWIGSAFAQAVDAEEDGIFLMGSDGTLDTVKVTAKQARDAMQKLINGNFCQSLARAAGRPCWAAPPTVGSIADVDGEQQWIFVADMAQHGERVDAVSEVFDVELDERWYMRYSGEEVLPREDFVSASETSESGEPSSDATVGASSSVEPEPEQARSAEEIKELFRGTIMPGVVSALKTIGATVNAPNCAKASAMVRYSFEKLGVAGGRIMNGKGHAFVEVNTKDGQTLIADATISQFLRDGTPADEALEAYGFIGDRDELGEMLFEERDSLGDEGVDSEHMKLVEDSLAGRNGDLLPEELSVFQHDKAVLGHELTTYLHYPTGFDSTPGIRRNMGGTAENVYSWKMAGGAEPLMLRSKENETPLDRAPEMKRAFAELDAHLQL